MLLREDARQLVERPVLELDATHADECGARPRVERSRASRDRPEGLRTEEADGVALAEVSLHVLEQDTRLRARSRCRLRSMVLRHGREARVLPGERLAKPRCARDLEDARVARVECGLGSL